MKHCFFTILAASFVCPGADALKQAGAAAKRAADPRLAEIVDAPALRRLLVIGDSISIGSTVPVREALAVPANVHRARDNCGTIKFGLERIDDWLGDRRWEVIHFNFGLHDMMYVDAKGRTVEVAWGQLKVSLPDYEKNLRAPVTRFQVTGARLVLATTTPVPTECVWRCAGEERPFNDVAVRVMAEMNVAIDDLAAFARLQREDIQRPRNVHFTATGCARLGHEAAKAVLGRACDAVT